MYGLWHISISSLYISFKLFLCWVIMNTLYLSGRQISLASFFRASRCSFTSSWSDRCILWYSNLIITSLKATYFWGDSGFKALLMFTFKKHFKYSSWQTVCLTYLPGHDFSAFLVFSLFESSHPGSPKFCPQEDSSGFLLHQLFPL